MIRLRPSRALFPQSCPCPRVGITEGTRARLKKKTHLMALRHHNERHIIGLASSRDGRYGSPVAANSATGFGDPSHNRRTGAPISIAGAFFVPAYPVYGGCAWETFGSAGFLLSRFANLRTAATLIRLATNRGSSSTMGAPTMTKIIPSAIRAIAHRRMALSALRANSSLSVRLKRYNHHMDQARALESEGGV
ncbi:hypothetical protein PS910_02701 [Pseudomonas fluorescens]|nr:hypothetical protein PS910_02701 [Pseudomonas fluorescens]